MPKASEHNQLFMEVKLTPAQIKALNGGAVTLIPAPGAGKVIEVRSFLLTNLHDGTTDYTWANSDHDITVGGASIGGNAPAVAVIAAAARLTKRGSSVAAGTTLTENVAVTIVASGTAQPLAGDHNFLAKVSYNVVDITK